MELFVEWSGPRSPLRCVQTCCSSNNYSPHCMSASAVQTGMLSPRCEQRRHPSRPLSTSTAPNNTSVLTGKDKHLPLTTTVSTGGGIQSFTSRWGFPVCLLGRGHALPPLFPLGASFFHCQMKWISVIEVGRRRVLHLAVVHPPHRTHCRVSDIEQLKANEKTAPQQGERRLVQHITALQLL